MPQANTHKRIAEYLKRNGPRAKGIWTSVADADGLYISTQVRLYGCDAPEDGQPGFIEAKAYLIMLFQKCRRASKIPAVRMEKVCVDCYGRVVAQVFISYPNGRKMIEVDVSEQLVLNGLAWATADEYVHHQTNAQKERRGIWADQGNPPVHPADWRDKHPRSSRPVVKAAAGMLYGDGDVDIDGLMYW